MKSIQIQRLQAERTSLPRPQPSREARLRCWSYAVSETRGHKLIIDPVNPRPNKNSASQPTKPGQAGKREGNAEDSHGIQKTPISHRGGQGYEGATRASRLTHVLSSENPR